MERKAYPSDVSDDEWAFVAPCLTLMTEDAPQREHSLREVFNGLRYIVRTGIQWRFLPNDLPPWYTVYQQTQRWVKAGVFEDLVHDLRMLLREIAGRNPQPSAAIFDSRTLQSTPESGGGRVTMGTRSARARRCIWPSTRWANCWRPLSRPPTSRSERRWSWRPRSRRSPATRLRSAFVDQGYTGEQPAATPNGTACVWKWSSCRRPSVASCSCPDAGSWSAISPHWLRQRGAFSPSGP